jgi:CheY-like chemotaxis protein
MPKILVVEDDEMNRDLLTRRLARKGFDAIAAVDGREGLEMAHSAHPDIILMDLSLPEIDGWEATRRIKADPETHAIPVIAITARAMAGDRERALAAGCDGYDTKPVEFSDLVAKIEALLAPSPVRP